MNSPAVSDEAENRPITKLDGEHYATGDITGIICNNVTSHN
jgi:hypothetical protein